MPERCNLLGRLGLHSNTLICVRTLLFNSTHTRVDRLTAAALVDTSNAWGTQLILLLERWQKALVLEELVVDYLSRHLPQPVRGSA